MMKHSATLFFLVGAITLCAAPLKVALIGEKEPVALLTAELSDAPEIQLLERTEIEKILQEHRLHAAALSPQELLRCFPHADYFAVVSGKRLIVFNGKNGFLIRSGESEHPADDLRRAIAESRRGIPLYLAIVSVRMVGIPQKREPQLEALVPRLEERLLRIPGVQILERSRLGLVTAERELTRQTFALAPSALLLSIEFEAKDDGVNAKVLVRDLDGQLAGRCEQNVAFADPEGFCEAVCGELQTVFQPEREQRRSRRTEAARFFEEFSALEKSDAKFTPECREKLEAALALAPDNPRYRFAEIRYRADDLRRNVPWPELAEEWPAQWERCRKFRQEVARETDSGGVMYTSYVLPGLNRRRCRPGSAEYRLVEGILREMRQLAGEEARLWHPCPAPETISTPEELNNFSRVCLSSCRLESYLSLEQCLKEQLSLELQFFRIAEKLHTAHPEWDKPIASIISRNGHGLALDFLSAGEFCDSPEIRRRIIRSHLTSPLMTEYLEFTRRSSIPFLQRQFLLLRYMRKVCAVPQEDEEERYAEVFREFFAEAKHHFPRMLEPPSGPTHYGSVGAAGIFENFVAQTTGALALYRRELAACRREHYAVGDWTMLEMMIRQGEKPEAFVPQVETLRKYNYDRLTKNKTANLYASLLWRLFDREGNFRSRAAEQLFFDANCAFRIETGRYRDLFRSGPASGTIETLLGSARTDDETWLLFRRSGDARILLGAMRDDGTVIPCVETPLKNGEFDGNDDVIARRPAPFTVSETLAVIGDKRGNLHCYDRTTQQWTQIPEFLPVPPVSLAVASDRIWGLGGGNLYKGEFCTLVSCAPDGSGRKIHFSTARVEPQNELDHLKIREVNSLLEYENMLLFSVTIPENTMVYAVSPVSGEFTRLVCFPFTGAGIDMLWRQRDEVYCFTMAHGERIYRIDPAQKRAQWLFNQSGERYRFDDPAARPVVLKGGFWQMNRPWCFRGKLLFSANCTPGVIDLASPERSPLLWLPACSALFERPDGVLFLGYQRYFIVKEKI